MMRKKMEGSGIAAVIAICWTTIAYGQQTTSDGCYQVWQNNKVNCMNAFKRSSAASEQQCRALCTQNLPRCQAAQFASSAQQCDLFDVFLPPASSGRRKRDMEEILRLFAAPREKRAGSYAYVRPAYQPPPPPGPQYRPAPAPAPAAYSGGCYGPTVQPVGGYTYCKPQQCIQTTPRPTPAPSQCPSGQVLRYYAAPGFRLQATPDNTFTAASEEACVQACTNNQQPGGTAAMCRSADYNSQSRQCQIYSSQSLPPNGTATAQADQNSKHFEKVCVDSSLARCQGPFFLGPQMILVGHAQSVVAASSMTECLSMCANSQNRFGFVCLSGMFYYQETTNNCILNSESRTTQPDLYNQENQDKVSYFEPACQTTRFLRQTLKQVRNRNVLELHKPEFGGWTMCDRMILDHKRFKGCSSLNPNKCVRDENLCDPKKEDQYDLQIVHPVKPTPGKPNVTTTPQPVASGGNSNGGQGNGGGNSNNGQGSGGNSNNGQGTGGNSNNGQGNGGNSNNGQGNGGNSNNGQGNGGSNGGNSNNGQGNGGNSNNGQGNGGNANNASSWNANGNANSLDSKRASTTKSPPTGGDSNKNNKGGGDLREDESKKSKNDTAKNVKTERTVVQARDSGGGASHPTGPVFPVNKCFALVNLDGTPDCEHGTMFDANGNRKNCQPPKDQCK